MNNHSTLVAGLSLIEKAALLSGDNTWQTRAIARLGIPAVWMSDGPHGLRKQVGDADHLGLNASELATCFPTSAAVAGSWDEELLEEIGSAIGVEAAAQGVGVLLGPGLNIKRSPLGGRNFEYFSEDPELSGRLAAAFVRGVQSQGVAASPKHFAVNSQERHRMSTDSIVDERTLRELYLTAFEIVVREAQPWTLMSSYNLVDGSYAHENHHLLTEILREEWGFDGAVVSDWGGGDDAVEAARAGGTIEMPSPGFDSVRQIVAAVSSGALSETDLDARVSEVLRLVQRVSRSSSAPGPDFAAHHALARRAAAESAVLLRNEDAILPLAPEARVVLIGDFAQTPRIQGTGSSVVNAVQQSTLIEAFAAAGRPAPFAQGFRRDGGEDPALKSEALALAASGDIVVLALGQPEIAESEGLDRSSLALPAVQRDLLRSLAASGSRVIVVLSAGGVVEMEWRDDAAAIVHGYLAGQAGAEALVDVLTGAVNPSGRLAETFPHRLADTPTAGFFPSEDRTVEYREGLFAGYRFYETRGDEVAYPFGFGLSYSTFSYTDLQVSEGSVRVTVTNTGERAGAEVVQTYVGRTGRSALPRAVRELKAFAKVRLQPGESQTVTMPLGERAFRVFTDGAWRVENGAYEISVGSHIRARHLAETLEVTGEDIPHRDLPQALPVADVTDEQFRALLGGAPPSPSWGTGDLRVNDPLDRLEGARSAVARFLFRRLDARRRKAEASGKPDLNILFLFNGPFRIISKMSGGLATSGVTDGLLTIVNGRFFLGLSRTVAAFFRGRRQERASAEQFRAAAGNAKAGKR